MKTIITLVGLLGSLSFVSCASAPQLDADALLSSVELTGDIRCEGAASVDLFGFLELRISGLAAAGGDVKTTEDSWRACVGTVLEAGPMRWAYVHSEQSTEACKLLSGTFVAEVISEAGK